MGVEDMSIPMPYDDRNDETGQFTPEFTDDEFIAALQDNGGATTSEVADAVGCKYRTAYNRLKDLEDEGRVTSREVGNSLLWSAREED
jgi:predicted transcriptional regulator